MTPEHRPQTAIWDQRGRPGANSAQAKSAQATSAQTNSAVNNNQWLQILNQIINNIDLIFNTIKIKSR